MVKFNFSGFY